VREFQVAAEAFAGDGFLVQLGILQGDRRLVGHAHQQGEVVLGELLVAVLVSS